MHFTGNSCCVNKMFLAKVKYLDLICLNHEKMMCLELLRTRNLFSTSTANHDNKSFNSSKRQSKIMAKLYGERMVGRKKRWFPTPDATSVTNNVKASNLISNIGISSGKVNTGGKNNSRRLTVLNKLFMQHITSMLATGETSERILNRGLQVTRVKVSTDYTNINVYWLGSGSLKDDTDLELELRRCSGLLRHELSQLELMGQVPRIHFVRDRSNANMVKVTEALNDLDGLSFGAESAKRELFGQQNIEPHVNLQDEIPEMRNDIYGLNQYDILMKILGKMRKSKQAWNTHNRQNHAPDTESSTKD